MNRVALIAVLAAAIFSGSVFFVLTTREPDDVGDGATPDAAAVADLPPKPGERDTTGPPPEPPSAPAAPTAPRRRTSGTSGTSAPGAPGAPGASARATLRIVSDVPGAQVFLDRKFVGAAPSGTTGGRLNNDRRNFLVQPSGVPSWTTFNRISASPFAGCGSSRGLPPSSC